MSIEQNYQDIKAAMQRAMLHFYCADNVDALPSYIKDQSQKEIALPEIIAVSKQQSEDRIEEALNAGLRHFGENKLQESQKRWVDRRIIYKDLTLHFMGPIQSNKVKDIVALFDVIHSVDREKIAKAIKEEAQKQNRDVKCYIQVNIGEEPQKSGVMPADLDAFLTFCRKDLSLSIAGLMCIPPAEEPSGLYFSLLKKLAQQHDIKGLSMGMSGDYEQAAILGAEYVRIGTALLGAR